jgi:hypothetical protein
MRPSKNVIAVAGSVTQDTGRRDGLVNAYEEKTGTVGRLPAVTNDG